MQWVVHAIGVPHYASTVYATVLDVCWSVGAHQDAVDLMRCPTVAGVPRQQIPFGMWRAGAGDDRSTEIRMRD